VAVPVYDLEEARKFYREVLGCSEGRTDKLWTDFDLYGHQFVIHYKPKPATAEDDHTNSVDGHDVPVPHFGAVLEMHAFEHLSQKLKASGVKFIIEPYIRFKGQTGEQATMFFLDPSGNAIEFKAFANIAEELFRR